MKSRLKYAGLGAALATATTAGLQAEVKINENLSLDGYVIGAGAVFEGTPAKNGPEFGKGGPSSTPWLYDAAYVAVNGKYKDFTSKVSLFAVTPFDNNDSDDTGVLDAYVTYKAGDFSITGGKYLGWLGFESFHSVNNAFISFSQAFYSSPWATGAKVEYTGDGFSTGVSVRDSQLNSTGSFFEGDGEIDDDIGYEAYFLFTGVEKLTVFAGAGFEDVDDANQGNTYTVDFWASYAVTDKFSLAAEYALVEDAVKASWLVQGTYALLSDLSVAGRVTGSDGDSGASDAIGYGVASTYTISPNFYVKGEVTKTDSSAASDVFSYALQGIFKF